MNRQLDLPRLTASSLWEHTHLASPLLRWATRVTCAAAIAFVTLLAVAPWQQFSSGQGQVIALSPMDRQQSIDAPISGRVVRWLVQEGTQVSEGTPLVEIVDIDPEYVSRLNTRRSADLDRLAAAEAAGEAYSEQVEAYENARRMKVRSAEMKVSVGEQKLLAARQKENAAQAELDAASTQFERQQGLAGRGLISQRALELAGLAVAKARAELNTAKAGVNEARANLVALEAERLRVDAEGLAKVRTAEAALRKAGAEAAYAKGDLAKVESDLSRQESRLVTAPRAGTILRIDGNQGGGVVSAGQRLAVLVPSDGQRATEIWIDGNDAPLVSPGRKVRLQFEGWPAVQFMGWPSVAVGTFAGEVQLVDAASSHDGKLRVVVVADPEESDWPDRAYLRLGGRAKAWVLLDQVPLWWELWRLVNGFPLSVPAAEAVDPAKGTIKPQALAY